MSNGLSPKLPLSISDEGDFALNKTYQELAKQNLKTLILTIPGEKIMEPDFGVGIHRFLFEQSVSSVYSAISNAINKQVSKYLPYIAIQNISIVPDSVAEEVIYISIIYSITPIGINDVLELTFSTNQ